MLARIDDLEQQLNDVEKYGLFDVPAVSHELVMAGKANWVRGEIICHWLWLLGYLKQKRLQQAQFQTTDSFQQAVKQFQLEAGLAADGWVGEESWNALQSLIGFESDTQLQRWYKGHDKGSAKSLPVVLQRAIQLRLWSLGLVNNKPGLKFRSVNWQGLLRFSNILWSFKSINKLPEKVADLVYQATGDVKEIAIESIIDQLFDHDRLVAAVAGNCSKNKKGRYGFRFRLHSLQTKKQQKILITDYLLKLAKIELWLLGEEVNLTAKDQSAILGLVPEHNRHQNKTLNKLMERYWREMMGYKKLKARTMAKAVRPELYLSFCHPQQFHQQSSAVPVAQPEISHSYELLNHDALVDTLIANINTADKIKNAVNKAKSLGLRLWDGAKRLWRLLKHGIKTVLHYGINRIRLFYQLAQRGFHQLHFTVRQFLELAKAFNKGLVPLDKSGPCIVGFDNDFDFIVYAQQNSHGLHSQAAKSVRIFAERFNLSIRIMAIVLRVFETINLEEWPKLVLTLVKSTNLVREHHHRLILL